MTKTIDVEIYGQRYAIKGGDDDEYVKRLAAYVDEQMRSLGQGMKTATLSKIAVLTAINIAHQLFEFQRLRESEEADVERRMLDLMDTIEEQIPASGIN